MPFVKVMPATGRASSWLLPPTDPLLKVVMFALFGVVSAQPSAPSRSKLYPKYAPVPG